MFWYFLYVFFKCIESWIVFQRRHQWKNEAELMGLFCHKVVQTGGEQTGMWPRMNKLELTVKEADNEGSQMCRFGGFVIFLFQTQDRSHHNACFLEDRLIRIKSAHSELNEHVFWHINFTRPRRLTVWELSILQNDMFWCRDPHTYLKKESWKEIFEISLC